MALDPKFQALLAVPGMQLGAPPPGVTGAMMREATKAMRPPVTPPPIHMTRDFKVPGPAGDIPVRLYAPSAEPDLPLIVFYHGGGFVVCDLDSHDVPCRMLALESGCAVVAVDYRLSPETKFPGPLEDCYAALVALVARAKEFGCDPTRVAVAGDSAGANLATAVCLLARERRGPAIRHQALFCPCLDARCDSTSMHELGEGYMLSRDVMKWFWEAYVAQPADLTNPLVSPVLEKNLAGLPPASITTAEYDPLRDEAEQYADQLRAVGVPVIVRRYNGMIHDFVTMSLVTEIAQVGIADVARDLRSALRAPLVDRIGIAQKLYQLALTGDFKTVESMVTDDFIIYEASTLPFAGTYRGKGALQELFVKVGGMLKLKDLKFRGFMTSGDDVAVLIDLIADRGGEDERISIVEVARFRGPLICELKPFYFDSAQVNAAAQANSSR
jgi:acetyl esterase